MVTWLRVMHVNVNAAFILTQSLLPLLRTSQDASIVFTTSGVSVRGRAYWGAYAASKFALEGLTQVLADETDTLTKIRVNSVNPGKVRTAMRARAYPGEDAATVPLPAVVLPTYLYLLGSASHGVTGQRFDAQCARRLTRSASADQVSRSDSTNVQVIPASSSDSSTALDPRSLANPDR